MSLQLMSPELANINQNKSALNGTTVKRKKIFLIWTIPLSLTLKHQIVIKRHAAAWFKWHCKLAFNNLSQSRQEASFDPFSIRAYYISFGLL